MNIGLKLIGVVVMVCVVCCVVSVVLFLFVSVSIVLVGGVIV